MSFEQFFLRPKQQSQVFGINLIENKQTREDPTKIATLVAQNKFLGKKIGPNGVMPVTTNKKKRKKRYKDLRKKNS